MVIVKKKIVDGRTYYYLEHSFREGNDVKKKELYLGSEPPKDIEKMKKDFMSNVYRERWHKILDGIKFGYSKEKKSMPVSARVKELESFMIKFTYNTQRIEGSKLTLRETSNLLERGITPKEKPVRDVKEAESHKKVFYEMLGYEKDLSMNVILYWHKKMFESTKPDIAGKIRNHGVAISGSKFIPPTPIEIDPLLGEFFEWYKKSKTRLHPVELAALVHLKFVTIHPFSDGNGRMSRLMMNFILKKMGFPLLDIPYENRNSYYNALERSQVKNNEAIFLQWYIKKYIKENGKYGKNSSN